MWTKFNALPNFAKIGIACFLVLVIYLSSRHQPQPPYHDGSAPPSINSASREAPSNTDARDELLARDKAELDELMPKITGCMAEIKRADDQMISDSMNQAALDPNSNRPECEQNLNEWMAEGLSLEAALKRAQTGDYHSSLEQIEGIRSGGRSTGGGGTNYRPSTGDAALDAVDRADRQGIRGHTMYTDSHGEQHELPTASHYYEDTTTGEFIPSESSTPPTDTTHTYVEMVPEN